MIKQQEIERTQQQQNDHFSSRTILVELACLSQQYESEKKQRCACQIDYNLLLLREENLNQVASVTCSYYFLACSTFNKAHCAKMWEDVDVRTRVIVRSVISFERSSKNLRLLRLLLINDLQLASSQ